ncbi:hypothetical protein LX99_01205 [Mucilaginibacter oryzae]|uniref:GLPGLI family protein n=1 Tax=Mucilaginibacter oryzae TaxID=468058 RepID=A0A316HF10_9SPHI|nr:hypothetical protein [Mucilaginibacter oryzae]PWK78753.1 hypothetical protein LX99_01205 [Mucilaginibacter oryzae]
MKPVFNFLSLLLFIIISYTATAQNMVAVNRMFANQNMQFNMQMQMNRSMMWGHWGKAEIYNPKHTFTVTMLDGTTKEVSSKIYADTTAHKSYLLFVDKTLAKKDSNRNQKIYPQQTKAISRVLSPYEYAEAPSNNFKGIAKDSCWMFKVVKGKISAYSLLSEEDDNMDFNPSTLVGLQLDKGDIVKFNEDNLKVMVGNDTDALEKIRKKDYLKAIKIYNRNAEKTAKNVLPQR